MSTIDQAEKQRLRQHILQSKASNIMMVDPNVISQIGRFEPQNIDRLRLLESQRLAGKIPISEKLKKEQKKKKRKAKRKKQLRGESDREKRLMKIIEKGQRRDRPEQEPHIVGEPPPGTITLNIPGLAAALAGRAPQIPPAILPPPAAFARRGSLPIPGHLGLPPPGMVHGMVGPPDVIYAQPPPRGQRPARPALPPPSRPRPRPRLEIEDVAREEQPQGSLRLVDTQDLLGGFDPQADPIPESPEPRIYGGRRSGQYPREEQESGRRVIEAGSGSLRFQDQEPPAPAQREVRALDPEVLLEPVEEAEQVGNILDAAQARIEESKRVYQGSFPELASETRPGPRGERGTRRGLGYRVRNNTDRKLKNIEPGDVVDIIGVEEGVEGQGRYRFDTQTAAGTRVQLPILDPLIEEGSLLFEKGHRYQLGGHYEQEPYGAEPGPAPPPGSPDRPPPPFVAGSPRLPPGPPSEEEEEELEEGEQEV